MAQTQIKTKQIAVECKFRAYGDVTLALAVGVISSCFFSGRYIGS